MRFRNLLSDLSGERIVILSTHIVSDVEATATRIALIARGRLAARRRAREAAARRRGPGVGADRAERGAAGAAAAASREWHAAPLGRSAGARGLRTGRRARTRGRVAPTLEDAYLMAMDPAVA